MSRPRKTAEGTERGHGPRVPRAVRAIAARSGHRVGIRLTCSGTHHVSARVSWAFDETAKWFAGVQVAASGSPPWKNAPPAAEAKNTFIFRGICDDTPAWYACGAFYGLW
jgi:hypothetical protein